MSLRSAALAISISNSADLAVLGLSEVHLQDAMVEIARYLLAQGARLVYAGDLRAHGFTQLLFELVARHRDNAANDAETGVVNYLAWPVHAGYTPEDLQKFRSDLEGSAELVCMELDGTALSFDARLQMPQQTPTEAQWVDGLTAMRAAVCTQTTARIVLGGAVANYKGRMPGIAEEALLSLEAGQPLYVLGGFGGCARDIAETLGLVAPLSATARVWDGRKDFEGRSTKDLNNGLTDEENATMARTCHIDQAITLLLRGLMHVSRPAPAS